MVWSPPSTVPLVLVTLCIMNHPISTLQFSPSPSLASRLVLVQLLAFTMRVAAAPLPIPESTDQPRRWRPPSSHSPHSPNSHHHPDSHHNPNSHSHSSRPHLHRRRKETEQQAAKRRHDLIVLLAVVLTIPLTFIAVCCGVLFVRHPDSRADGRHSTGRQ